MITDITNKYIKSPKINNTEFALNSLFSSFIKFLIDLKITIEIASFLFYQYNNNIFLFKLKVNYIIPSPNKIEFNIGNSYSFTKFNTATVSVAHKTKILF